MGIWRSAAIRAHKSLHSTRIKSLLSVSLEFENHVNCIFEEQCRNFGIEVQLLTYEQSPIRPDIVHSVHTGMNKNKRQPYAV